MIILTGMCLLSTAEQTRKAILFCGDKSANNLSFLRRQQEISEYRSKKDKIGLTGLAYQASENPLPQRSQLQKQLIPPLALPNQRFRRYRLTCP